MTAFALPSFPSIRQRRTSLSPRQSKRPPRRTPPSAKHTTPHPLQTLVAGIAGATLALTITQTPPAIPPPAPAHAEAVAEPLIDIDSTDLANLPPAQRKALKQQSVRNTRAAGKTAQLFSTARREAESGDLEAALSDYNRIIAASPTFAPAYSNRANIYVAGKRFAEALEDYTRCLSLAPLDGDSWVVFVNRGATKLALGDTPGALADMNVAYALKGNSEIVLSNRAGIYEMLGKWDNAIRDYQAALKSNDVRPFWERYGLVLFQRNKTNEAVAILKRVATRFNVSDVHAALAIIYFDQGNVADAETEWSRVDRPRLFESRAFLEGERKWPPRAVEAMDRFRLLKEIPINQRVQPQPPSLDALMPATNEPKHNMSLAHTRTSVLNAANASIVEMLEQQLEETTSTNYKHTLRRALRAIRVFAEPIVTKAKALEVPNVGHHIATQIEIHLLQQQSPRGMAEPGAVLLPDEQDPAPTQLPAPTQSPAPTQRRPRARAAPRRKEYIPQYRTAAYGILIALYDAESSGITAMRKDELARSAQQYSDKPILAQASEDPSSWYQGWSAVNKTLVPKGLVARGGNPIKFSLSATGRELAERLIQKNNDVVAMAPTEYRPDGPVDVGVSNLPHARRISPAGPSASTRGRAQGSPSRSFAGASKSHADNSQDQSQVLSQEDADMEMARALSRRFNEEDAVPSGARQAVKDEPGQASERPLSKPVADVETASTLEQQYRKGLEFGAVAPGVPPSTPQRSKPASQGRRRKLTSTQCDRATRAIQRLEAGGYSLADCIKIVEILHGEKALPRSVDGIYQAVVNALWEAEKQERRLERSAEPIGLRISALAADDDDDDITAYENRQESSANDRETPELEKPSGSGCGPSDAVLRASRVDRVAYTPELRRVSKRNSKDAVVVIDLDEDSVLELGSQKASIIHHPHRTSSNPPKRPRVTEVIAIDSDEEGTLDTNNIRVSVSPTQVVTQNATADQRVSSQECHPRCENGAVSMIRNNAYPDVSPRQGIRGCEASMLVEIGLQTGGIHTNQSLHPGRGEECRVVLLLDSMERFRNSNTIARHVKSPGDLLLVEGVDSEVRSLPIGDALFVARFPDESEVVLDYIIERKTIDDYGSSMKDGRVARQTYLMRHANIKRRIFLLEGDLRDNEDLYNKTELHKKLAEMTMCSGLYVKHTRDILDTVHFYASLFRRLQKKFLRQSKAMTLRERGLYSEWNDRMSTMKKSLTLEQLFMIQLCQIPGVGTTKAQAIIEMGYTTPFLLYTAYKRLDSQGERDEMLNKGEHAIGSSSSRAVSLLFNQREYPTVVKKEQVAPFSLSSYQ